MSETKSISEVLMNIEAREFWERVYLALIEKTGVVKLEAPIPDLCDSALAAWKQRFEPK